eukprot:Lankesteria_metandrocarpae@DN5480_c0_g1_i14.p1
MLKQAIIANSTVAVKTILGHCQPESFEAMIGMIAKKLFPTEHEVMRVENVLFMPPRAATVMLAQDWMLHVLARYARLCNRHDWSLGVGDSKLRVSVLACVPKLVEAIFREQRGNWNIPVMELFDELQQCEVAVQNSTGLRPDTKGHVYATGVFDNNEMLDDLVFGIQQRDVGRPVERKVGNACRGCGSANHPYRTCFAKSYRCNQCREIGHFGRVCPSYVKKDVQGRVVLKTTAKPSGVSHFVKQDRTVKEQMDKVSATMEKFKEKLIQASNKAKERKDIQLKAEGSQRQPRANHPVGVAMSDIDTFIQPPHGNL